MLKGVIVLFVPYERNKRHIDNIENNYPKLLPYIDTLFGYKDMLHSVHTNIKYMDNELILYKDLVKYGNDNRETFVIIKGIDIDRAVILRIKGELLLHGDLTDMEYNTATEEFQNSTTVKLLYVIELNISVKNY